MKYCMSILVILLSCFLHGCRNFIATAPHVNFHKQNVLRPEIRFQTENNENVFIEYWPENLPNRVQKSRISSGTQHDIILLNIAPSTKYNYLISTSENDQRSDTFSFTTGVVPENVFNIRKDLIDTTLFDGYILVRNLYQPVDAIINREGDIVWYNTYDTLMRRAFAWTDRQSILSIYDSAHIVEFDLYGNRLLNLRLEQLNISNKVHHEVLFNKNHEIVALTLDSAKMDLRKFGGRENQNLRADGLLIVSEKGEKIWEWNLLQQTNPLLLKASHLNLRQSWGHGNSFAIDKDGHYVVSFKGFNQVWKINSVDGSIIWKLGRNGDFKMDEDAYFIGQHSVHFNKRGELMMFNNGDQKIQPNSRILAFSLDEKAMKAETRINVKLPLELSAYRMGSAELIDTGKYLVCTSRGEGPVTVVNDQGNILWKVVLNTPSYRTYYLENPFGFTP